MRGRKQASIRTLRGYNDSTIMIRQFFSDYWPLLLAVTNLVLACWATLHAVLRKRDSRAVIGWVALAWMVPIIGALAYFGLGVNRIQRKAIALRIGEGLPTEVEPELNASDYRMMEEQLDSFKLRG